MSKQSTVKINPSFYTKIDQLEVEVEDAVGRKLMDIAETIINFSPVDTGAYVTSHSVKSNTSSRGRGKSSKGKPKADKAAKKSEGLNNLMKDINALDLSFAQRFTFRNDSPHAQVVDRKYNIYGAIVRNIHG